MQISTVFPAVPALELSDEDREKLSSYLGNWNTINDLFQLADLDPLTLKKLIEIERTTLNRTGILRRLIGRLFSVERALLNSSLGI